MESSFFTVDHILKKGISIYIFGDISFLNLSDITPICEVDFITDFDLITNCGGFHRTLQRVRLANRGRLLLRTPGPVPFGTCICSNVETILS